MFLRRLAGIVCLCVIAVWAGARAVAIRSESSTLINLEHQFFRSIANRELPTVRSLLADDCMIVISGVGILSEQDVVSRVASSDRIYDRNEPYDLAIRLHGDTAIVAGMLHQRYRAGGIGTETRLRYMHTWVRSGRSWRLLSSHSAATLSTPR